MNDAENMDQGFVALFKRHGLVGLITAAHLLLIFYLVSTFNQTIQDSTVALKECTTVLKELKGTIERASK
jgi:hypothetical protein